MILKKKYYKENNLYTRSRSELQITVSHQLSAAILLFFISAAVGYFAQGSYLERGQQVSKIQKHISLVFQFEKNMVEWPFDFQISNFTESQTLRSFLQAGDFILAENIKLIDMIKEINCRKNKLLIGAIEPTLKSLRMGGETEAGPTPRTGSSR